MAEDLSAITPAFLKQFSVERAAIEKDIDHIANATKQLDMLVQQAGQAFSPDDLERISKQLTETVKSAQLAAAAGKNKLEKLKHARESLQRTCPESARLQVYKMQTDRLCGMYVTVVKDHQKSKERMRKVQTETLVRRGKLIMDHMDEAEIREKVEADPSGFLKEAIMHTASEEAQQAYEESQSRAHDIDMLIRSLNEVAQMFQDLASLVQHQSELLDSIESNVEVAGKYIRKGNASLKSAIEAQKKTRKCYCCLIVVVGIIIIALVGGLAGGLNGAIKLA